MRTLKLIYSFSSSKYFLDSSFKNISLIGKDEPGTLMKICSVFSQYRINLGYMRTYFTNINRGEDRKYRIDVSYHVDGLPHYDILCSELKNMGVQVQEEQSIKVPWFPKNIQDLNSIGHSLMEVKESKDHAQFQDAGYRQRRDQIARISKNYKMGDQIPDVLYTQQEEDVWRKITKKLKQYHQKSMCQRFLKECELLEKELQISKKIPQLGQLSLYLKNKTGFQLKPTHGILSQREFLNALAFKYFCSTQYIRNVKNPQYTPEPDIVHEIMGHVPMFADPEIAKLSQKIGLLSLGASDEELTKLGNIYWFTLQYGTCKQNGNMRAFGAGIASSYGEIEHFLSDKARFKKFEPFKDCIATYPIQTVQPLYRFTESFTDALLDIEAYGRTIMKPITTVYNQITGQIQYDRHIEAICQDDNGVYF